MMNEELELVGVIGIDKFPLLIYLWDGRQAHSNMTDERIAPIMFKNLPVGTQLFVKKVEK